MKSVTPEISQKIKNMSIVCAMLVVAIHITWRSADSTVAWLIDRGIREGVASIAVPYFFLISGFFLARHFEQKGWYAAELKKRISSLLVPYCLMVVISICVALPLPVLADFIAHRPFGTSIAFLRENWYTVIGLDPRKGPSCNGPLWYIRCLLLFVALSPVFKIVVFRLGVAWLFVAFLGTLFHHSTYWQNAQGLQSSLEYGFSLSGALYFSLGFYLAGRPIDTRKTYGLYSGLAAGVLLALKLYFDHSGINCPVHLPTLFIPFGLYTIWSIMPSKEWPTWLTSSSFPIYIIHFMIIPYFILPLKGIGLANTTFGNLTVCLFAALASIVVVRIIHRLYPMQSRLLFANRTSTGRVNKDY